LELTTLKRSVVAIDQSVEPQNDVVKVLLQGVRVQFRLQAPPLPVPDTVTADIARHVTDEGDPLHDLTEILTIRNVTFPLRRGAASVAGAASFAFVM
jgi:hypothetical protein